MPIYEFQCKCGEEEEVLVSMETKTIKCKQCGSAMKKIISRTSFILKGTGWAKDGYAKVNSTKKK